MVIQYESTMDEAVACQFRLAELLGVVSKIKWFGVLMAPLIGLAMFIVLDPMAAKLILGGSASVLFLVYHLSSYKKSYRKRIRRMLKNALGTDAPIPSAYEIDESGLVFRKMGQELRFSWANVVDVVQTSQAIEIIMEPMGIAILPKRIFADATECEAWTRYIESRKGRDGRAVTAV